MRSIFGLKIHRRRNRGETSPASSSDGPSSATPLSGEEQKRGETPPASSSNGPSSATPLSGEEQKREIDPQSPPSYTELFPHSHADLQADPPMDPLVAAAWHNQTVSPLHQLPDHILTQIINMLDNCGIECIRRAARRFPPLCTEIILGRLRTHLPCADDADEEADNYRGPFVWPRFYSMSYKGQAEELLRVVEGRGGMPEDRPRLLRLLHRDWYCEGCRAAEEAPGWGQRVERLRRFLYCSKCAVDHPACLFSASQRLEKSHFRVCIGHEGYLRICGHEQGIVRWSDVLGTETKTGVERLLQCKHKSHTLVCAERPLNAECPVFQVCDDSLMCEYIHPTLEICKARIYTRWNAHLTLGRTEWPLTAAVLRPRLAEIRDNAGRFICPTTAPGMDLPEFRCFDPNNCDCVRFEGSQNISSFKGGHTDPTQGLLPPSGQRWQLEPCMKCYCITKIHGKTRLDAIGTYCYGTGESNARILPCHSNGRCLVLRYRRSFPMRTSQGYIYPHWYQALDPDSYNLTADRDGLGVYWCRQQQCRNYYGRLPGFSRIILSSEYSRKCCRSYEEASR